MIQKLTLSAAARTDPGRVHAVDQDSAYAFVRDSELGKMRGLFIVADGMGGHQAGDVASKLAVETISAELEIFLQQSDLEQTRPVTPALGQNSEPPDEQAILEQRLLIAIRMANDAITRYAANNPVEAGNLGTTLTCVLVNDNRALIANIGDSRTYLLRNGALQQLTEDHSYVAYLVREGQIAPEEIFVHPRRNVITRSLGYRQDVQADFWKKEIFAGDQLLLCSDGLWEMVQDETLMAEFMLSTGSPSKAVDRLIESANENGGVDNIGVVVVHVGGNAIVD